MARASIPVDLLNPGQVFACLGFLEAAESLFGGARGGFDWSNEDDTRFHLQADSEHDPVEYVLTFLARCSVHSVSPKSSDLSTEKWNVSTTRCEDDIFPFPSPTSPATLPAIFDRDGCDQLSANHWGEDKRKTSRDNVKFWAGAAGYPGAALARDALDLIRDMAVNAANDPFNLMAEQSSSFRFDWRRDYIPLDIGFSINSHSSARFSTIGYPLVEILAAIGLTNARPTADPKTKLKYQYGVLGLSVREELYEPLYLRAALGGAFLPFPRRIFQMRLGWPGKENQARCITTVFEVSKHE